MNLFLFSGRIGRLEWWIIFVGLTVINITVCLILFTLGIVEAEVVNGETVFKELSSIAVLLMTVIGVPMLWVSIVSNTKRLHDRGKNGFWQLIGCIPIIGIIWFIVELGILPGDTGGNRFGPPPNEGSSSKSGRRVGNGIDKSWAKQGGYTDPNHQLQNNSKPVFGKRTNSPMSRP